MYDDTVTIFNRYESSSGIMWYPTVISDVNVIIDKAAIIAKYGAESQDAAVVNIRYGLENGAVMVEKKKWLPPKGWKAQSSDMLPQTITFASGEAADFFLVGDYGSEEPIADNAPEFGRNGFYNYMNKSHDFVFAITGAAKLNAIPHFEIRGA